MDEDEDGARAAFGNFLGHMAPGMTNKVLKNAPKYLVDEYKACVAALQEKSRDIPTSDFSSEEEWSEAVAIYMANSAEMYNYKDIVSSLMNILKVVIALEIVLEGEVRHDHDY